MNRRVVITLAVNDSPSLTGYAPVGELPGEAWDSLLRNNPRSQFLADLWEGDCHTDDRYLTDEQASALLAQPVAALVSLGRQRIAALDDEASEHIRAILDAKAEGK